MQATIATLICFILVAGLFWLDRDRAARTSKALWIPLIWILINCSRPVSVWLGISPPGSGSDLYLDGSPVDRFVFLVLLIAGLIILFGRKQQAGALLRTHGAILLFFSFAALSVLWSNYPYVTFKHWTKGISDVVMVMIVVTDPVPMAAVKRVVTRAGFILMPLSLLFSKYYPSLGRDLTRSWTTAYVGVTMGKNALGEISLIFGLGSLWCLLAAWRDREDPNRTRHLLAHGALFGIVVAIFWIANAVTSQSCLIMVGVLMVLASQPSLARRPSVVHLLVAAVVGLTLLSLFFNPGGSLLEAMGRNPTLTGRKQIWHQVLSVAGNPLVGTGYASFWLGPRLHEIWSMRGGAGLQESHDGYLEIYLNLGWVGVSIFAAVMVTGYRKVIAAFRANPGMGILSVAWFTAGALYSLTEDGFRMLTPIWIFFLLAIMTVPETVPAKELHSPGLDRTEDLPVLDPAVGPGFGFLEETGWAR